MSRKFMTSLGIEEFDTTEEITQEEAALQAEEIEVADVETEIVDEAEEITDFSDQTDDIEAEVEEMEVLEDEVETALEEDNLEAAEVGLEALRGRCRSLQRRHGFDFSGLLDSVSKESIGSNPRHKRTNIQHGLEKFSDTIKKIWQAIKDAFAKAWAWLKSFWDRYFTEIGRLEAAVTKYKKSVNDAKGAPVVSGDKATASSNLQKVFAGSTIDAAAVNKGLAVQKEATETIEKALETFAKAAAEAKSDGTPEGAARAVGNVVRTLNPILTTDITLGTKDSPLVTGFFGTLKGSSEGEGDEKKVKFEFTKDKANIETGDDRKFTPGDKSDLNSVLSNAEALLKATRKLGETFKKDSKDFDAALGSIDKAVTKKNAAGEDSATSKAVEILSRNFQAITKTIPGSISTVTGLNTTAVSAALQYVGASLKTFSTGDKEKK